MTWGNGEVRVPVSYEEARVIVWGTGYERHSSYLQYQEREKISDICALRTHLCTAARLLKEVDTTQSEQSEKRLKKLQELLSGGRINELVHFTKDLRSCAREIEARHARTTLDCASL